MNTSLIELGVSINVLRVGEKPMTIAVFKQIPGIDHIENDVVVFGWVNFRINHSSTWFVSTFNGSLYKSAARKFWLEREISDTRYRMRGDQRYSSADRIAIESELSQKQSIVYYETTLLNTKPQLFITA